MKKFLTRAAGGAVILIMAAALCLAGCPSPTSGGGDPAREAANAFKTAHAGALGKTADTVTVGDEAAVSAALAAYESLGLDLKSLLRPEKTLLDSLKTKIDELKGGNPAQEAADAFKTAHAEVLGKTADTVTIAGKDAVEAALDAYNALDADAKALLAGEKALLDSLKAKIAGLAATADQKAAADAFKTGNSVLEKTADTVTVADKGAVDAALAAYEALGETEKGLLAPEKTLLDSLKTRIDALSAAQEAADGFKTAHAAVLARTADNITTADGAAVNAALADYNALGADAKALLAGEKTLLDSLKAEIAGLAATAGQKAAAEAFKTGNSVLEKTADTVTAADKDAVDAALAAYEALGETEKGLLAPEKALLDSLKARIDALSAAREAANAFKTSHAAVLARTTDNITTGNDAAVSTALAAYNALDADAKALLAGEKALLDSLKTKIEDLKNDPAWKSANSFKTAHAAVLARTEVSVGIDDEAIVGAALAAYDALGADAKALLAGEKTLLDSFKKKIDQLKSSGAAGEAAGGFIKTHAVALGKTTVAVTAADEPIVGAALAAYNALGADAKALLAGEKALLDSLKTRIDALIAAGTAANAFKTAHAVALAKTTADVTAADEAIVGAALAAYNALDTDVKALLTGEKALLDSLKTRIDALIAAGTAANAFKTAHAVALAKTAADVTAADEGIVGAALAAYNALGADAKALLAGEKALLDSLKAKIETLNSIITFTAVADGAANTTTSTSVAFSFSAAVSGLAAADITVGKTGDTGTVTKGALTGTGQAWNLALASVGAAGNVTVSISKAGIESAGKTVAVYKDSGDPGNPPPDLPRPPAQPTGLKASPRIKAISLGWSAAARAETYEVYYSTGTSIGGAVKFNLEPAEPKTTVTGLADGTVYNFWVKAKNQGGSSAASRMFTAARTSDPLPAAFTYNGSAVSSFEAGNGGGDFYQFKDLGENMPPEERYKFGYCGPFDSPGGTIKFVRQFANPPEEPQIGLGAGGGPGKGVPVSYEWDINRGVIIYQYDTGARAGQFQATYWLDYSADPRPQAVMGQANGYTSGLGNDQETDTLDEAIEKFGLLGGPGMERGKGGRYDYFTMMRIYYQLNPWPVDP
jgi:hypothetical protein